ncbi:DUF5719 family protein [Microbacterium sp. NPDC096154]|uniref:DUF5719 family protein n=1 Tax=Microbacterium sp. NPDC096154 TaxID=3155549 RepID=UPI003319D173
MRITAAQRTLGTRLIMGGLVAAGSVVAVTAAAALPWPAVATPPPALEVTPVPAETILACDGPVLALGRTVEDAGGLSAAAPSRQTAGNDRGEQPASDALAQPAVAGEAAAARFVQKPDGREPVSVAAASSVRVDEDDLGGYSASACRPPQMESWIVGGDTETGSTGILLLANPGDVSATVQVTVYGVAGAVTPPGAEAVPIPPRTQVALPLAGLAGGESRPSLRVTATGAPVRASLQSSIVRTLEPGGIDTQSAVRPATVQVIPGLRVVTDADGAQGASSIARLLSESDTRATITVTKAGDGAEPARAPESVALTAGAPLDVDLGALDKGEYTVTVTSEAPLVAAVWHTTGFGAGSDYAWHTAAPPISDTTLVAVPDGDDASLNIANPAAQDVTVSVAGQGDDPQDVDIAAGDTVVIDVRDDKLYSIDPRGSAVHVSVGFANESALASVAVWPDAARPEPVTVYP